MSKPPLERSVISSQKKINKHKVGRSVQNAGAIKYNQSNVSMNSILNSGTPSISNNKKNNKPGRNTTYNARSPVNMAPPMTPTQQQV